MVREASASARSSADALRRELRDRLRPVVRGIRDRGRSGYSNTGEEQVIQRLLAGVQVPEFCVDIGASDGRTMSNLLALFERGWRGLSVEMDGESFRSLATLHAQFPGSSLFRGRVTPDNVVDVLRAAEPPDDFGVLSLDIDGYDFFLLDRVLTAYRPAIICTEVNEKIPPPLRFTVKYSPDYSWDASHFYGQSISQLHILCERYGYVMAEMEYNNAFLMPADIAPRSLTPEEAYRTGTRTGLIGRRDSPGTRTWSRCKEWNRRPRSSSSGPVSPSTRVCTPSTPARAPSAGRRSPGRQ